VPSAIAAFLAKQRVTPHPTIIMIASSAIAFELED
jgi:hypothetical protein